MYNLFPNYTKIATKTLLDAPIKNAPTWSIFYLALETELLDKSLVRLHIVKL